MNPLFKSAISINSLALVVALALVIGCTSDENNEGPWITIQEDEIGSAGAGAHFEDDGTVKRKFFSINEEFSTLLEYICNDYEVSIVVRPADLLDRGIEISIIGSDAKSNAKEILESLASQCDLELERLGDDKWRLAAKDSADSPEGTVTFDAE
ncbi:MAG: hypothetical protein ACYTG0_47040 [Planctomycetota bacterium]